MIERVIKRILVDGLDYFKSDSRRLIPYFTRFHGLDEAEAVKIRTYFDMNPEAGEPGGPPNVVLGYPRSSGPWPCWAIILADDQVPRTFIGNDAANLIDEGEETEAEFQDPDGESADAQAVWCKTTVDVSCYVQHIPDICLYYYQMLKGLVLANIQQFTDANLQNVMFSGRELMPDPRYLPENIWIRQLSISVEYDLMSWAPRAKGSEMKLITWGEGAVTPGS